MSSIAALVLIPQAILIGLWLGARAYLLRRRDAEFVREMQGDPDSLSSRAIDAIHRRHEAAVRRLDQLAALLMAGSAGLAIVFFFAGKSG